MTHLGTTKHPMSEARRNEIHGPLQSLIENRPAGEIHPALGGALLIGLFVVAAGFVIAFS